MRRGRGITAAGCSFRLCGLLVFWNMESGTWYLDLIFLGLSPFCFWLQKFDEESMGEEEGSQAGCSFRLCGLLVFSIWYLVLGFLIWLWFLVEEEKKKFDEESQGGITGGMQFSPLWVARTKRGQRELWGGEKCKQRNKEASILEWQTHKLIMMDVRVLKGII